MSASSIGSQIELVVHSVPDNDGYALRGFEIGLARFDGERPFPIIIKCQRKAGYATASGEASDAPEAQLFKLRGGLFLSGHGSPRSIEPSYFGSAGQARAA